MTKESTQPLKTVLTISIGFTTIYLITNLNWTLYVALFIGFCGLFSQYIAAVIHMLWTKLAYVLSLIVPNIFLSLIFYFILFPLSLVSKLFKTDSMLILSNKTTSSFISTNKIVSKKNFEKPW